MRSLLLLSTALVFSASGALAQSWPAKPIRMIQAAAAGTSGDVAARLFADRLQKSLGQGVVVENIAGAAGLVGAQTVARAAPDGYTLFFASSATVVSADMFFTKIPYDLDRDFTAIANLIEVVPFAIAASVDQPFRTLPELLKYAKANPGKLSYGIEGSPHRLIGQLVVKRGGIDMQEIRYKATQQSAQDALAGRIVFIISSLAATEGLVKSGKMRRIAVASAARFPGLEDMPTVNETLPGVVVDGAYYLMGPAGLPMDIARRLNREADAYVKDPEVAKRLLPLALKLAPSAGTPESTADLLRRERTRWAQLTREVGFQPE